MPDVRSRTSEDRDRAPELREALDRTGYYPEVVADAVDDAVAGEPVDSFYVHHEPTFERDEVRRHQSVRAHPDPADARPHRRARRRRPAARAVHLDLDRGDEPQRGVVGGRHPDDRPTRPRARSRRSRQCSPSGGAPCTGSTWSPPAATTRSARPTTATPAPSRPTTSPSGCPPPPTAPDTLHPGLLSFAASLSARTRG